MGDALPSTPPQGQPQAPQEHILMTLPFPEPVDILDRLRAKYPHITITYRSIYIRKGTFDNPHEEDVVPDDLFARATILVTLTVLPPTAASSPRLKFIHFISSGTDHILTHPLYSHSAIPLTTSSGIAAPMISEWVILQILSNSHKYSMLLEWQAQKKWQDMAAVAGRRDAVGMRVGILGYGSIGRQVGRVCAAMGMDVVAYTSRPRATASSRRDTGYVVPGTGDIDGTIPSQWFSGSDTASLHRFLGADLDILLVSIPLTKGTRQLLAAPEFRILGKKRNALVINISRGGILNQDDLVRYCRMPLEEGGLRGAALDVTDPEPLPPSSELWEVGNVVITPHISGLSREYLGRSLDVLDLQLERLQKGEGLINVVDRGRGY